MNRLPNSNPGQDAFEQGIAQINRGYHDQGQVLLQEAARLGHPHAAAVLVDARFANKVISLAQAGQRNLALAYLEEARRQSPAPSGKTIDQMRQALDKFTEGQFIQPTTREGWNEMGANLVDAGKFKEATICFQKAIELDFGYETAWLNLGLACSKSNDFQTALLVFDKLLSIKPRSFHAWHLKGMTLGSLQKHDEAIACYDQALRLTPQLPEAWYNKSLALGHLQRHDESVASCDRALELNPRHLAALLQKARALHRLGRDAEAQECGELMFRIDPVAAKKLWKTG